MEIRNLIQYAKEHPELINLRRWTNKKIIKLNYTKQCQYSKNNWNEYTEQSRGIILNEETNKIVSNCLKKFWNVGEIPKTEINNLPKCKYEITNKEDGVLIIPFIYDNKVYLSTRGSFESTSSNFDFIGMASKLINENFILFYPSYSFLFELVSPLFHEADFLIKDYNEEALILIGVLETESGRVLNYHEICKLIIDYRIQKQGVVDVIMNYDDFYIKIKTVMFNPLSISELMKLKEERRTENKDDEGWVILFENGLMVKIKRDQYVDLLFHIRKPKLRRMVNQKLSVNDIKGALALFEEEEVMEIRKESIERLNQVNLVYDSLKHLTKRDFAFEVLKNYTEVSDLLFSCYNNKDLNNLLIKKIIKEKLN